LDCRRLHGNVPMQVCFHAVIRFRV
jgi:hypothetical protein